MNDRDRFVGDAVGSSGLLLFFALAYAFTWSLHLAIPLLGIPFSLDLAGPAVVLYMLGLLGPQRLTSEMESFTHQLQRCRDICRPRNGSFPPHN